MRIQRVETFELSDLGESSSESIDGPITENRIPDLLFILLHTDSGLVGLGEGFPQSAIDAEVIHDRIADHLFDADPHAVEKLWREIYQDLTWHGGYGGAEIRALSAVDIALWDLKGKSMGEPIYELLGGKTRQSIRTYNTCYDDEFSFMTEPVEFAESLLEDNIRAMKIWPYDGIAKANDGQYIHPTEVEAGAEPLKAIRDKLGVEMDVALEFHGLWNVRCAKQIARHVEQYCPMWLEELIPIGSLEAYRNLGIDTAMPLAISERLPTKYGFNDLLSRVNVDTIMFDIEWVGGFTEAKKIAALAEANEIPVTPHNCGGPVLHFANLHLGAVIPNLAIMESVRSRYDGWFSEIVTTGASISDGQLALPEGPGLGTSLREEFLEADGVHRRISERCL